MIIDLTGIAASVVAGVFSILSIVIPLLIQAHLKDAQAATVLANAIANSLGAMQQAASGAVQVMAPRVTMPGVPRSLQIGVQYVLDHAGDEAARLGITPQAVADKISAKVGLAAIATNAAVAGSSAPVVPDPLAPLTPATLPMSVRSF